MSLAAFCRIRILINNNSLGQNRIRLKCSFLYCITLYPCDFTCAGKFPGEILRNWDFSFKCGICCIPCDIWFVRSRINHFISASPLAFVIIRRREGGLVRSMSQDLKLCSNWPRLDLHWISISWCRKHFNEMIGQRSLLRKVLFLINSI